MTRSNLESGIWNLGNKKALIRNSLFMIRDQRGVFLPTAISLTFVFMIIALAIADYALANYTNSVRNVIATNSLFAAEAGAEKALLELNEDASYTPPSGEVELYNSEVKGRATYETVIANGSVTNEKIITVTGRVYRPSTSSTPKVTRKVRVTVIAAQSDFNYAVQTGPGALIMQNSAVISNGQVRINGYIDMRNSARIGSAANPVEVWVADNSCPTGGGATYPVLCGSTHKSITIENPAWVYAAVHKKNTVDSDRITGTIDEVGADAVDLPADNRSTIKPAIQDTGTTMDNDDASCDQHETRTWGNLHITGGDVVISNNCVVTITGNVWIDGKLETSNNSEIRVSDSLSAAPTIMIDGSGGFKMNNSSKLLSNATNVAAKIITFYCGSSCSPDSTPTGDALFNSKDVVTIEINNAAGAAGSVMYARWSRAVLSNGTAVGAMVGQSVELKNSGSITFGASLGGGGSDVFAVKFYQEIFD